MALSSLARNNRERNCSRKIPFLTVAELSSGHSIRSLPLRFHIAPQHRAYARLIALAGALEEVEHLRVETKRDLLLVLGQQHLGVVPEARWDHAGVGVGRGAAFDLFVGHLAKSFAEWFGRRQIVQAIADDPAALFCRSRAHSDLPSMPR